MQNHIKGSTDDINKAIGESVRLCLDILDSNTQVVDMKGE